MNRFINCDCIKNKKGELIPLWKIDWKLDSEYLDKDDLENSFIVPEDRNIGDFIAETDIVKALWDLIDKKVVPCKRVNPDISIDIDVTFATDEGRGIKPESYGDIELGKGPVIMNGPDKSWNLRCKMIGVAEINEIPYQLAASYAGGTNTSAIQEGAFDCETMLVSIPQRNMHTQVEVCDYRDVEGAINLISKTLLEITK